MFIQELVLEGFKSYARRTVISGWDNEFNAITGLNGSGKSNILDAICFVLGIENLRHVRATSLQDLIYKRGQAGINQATVSIVFNNEDPSTSPVGFNECATITVTRQIVLGGKNKYLINGHTAQHKTIENLFQSVQLNVNNPHFLIMQGQITKVLNMKPQEILGMIEETAGTRMFEDRKQKALVTMEKKEKKVEEIMNLLQEIIIPKLDRLRDERSAFIEYQKTETELDRLKRIKIAHEYYNSQQIVEKLELQQERNTNDLEEMKNSLFLVKADLNDIENRIEELEKENNLEDGNELEKGVSALSNQLVKLKTQLDLKEESIREESNRKLKSENAIIQIQDQLARKRQELEVATKEFQEAKKECEESQKKMSIDENVLNGSSVDNLGYHNQVNEAKHSLSLLSVQFEQLEIEMKHYLNEIKELEPKARKAQLNQETFLNEFRECELQAKNLQEQLKLPSPMSEAEFKHLTNQRQQLLKRIENNVKVKEDLMAQLSQFSFQHKLPNLQPKIYGCVATLINLSEEQLDYANALEVTAGGKLYFVIVDDSSTASQLLEKGRLVRRVTIIPLNKINSPNYDQKIKYAKNICPDKVDVALSLIGYPKEVEKAMKFVFGSTLICHDRETANKVAFDPKVRMKSVTLDGDVYDPIGTLTGGSTKNQRGGLLKRIYKLAQVKLEIKTDEASLKVIDEKWNEMNQDISKKKEIEKNLELKNHALSLMKQEMEKNSDIQCVVHLDILKAKLEENHKNQNDVKEKQKNQQNFISQLEKDIQELDENREQKLLKLQKAVQKQRKQVQKMQNIFTEKHVSMQMIEADIQQLEQEAIADRDEGGDLEALISQKEVIEQELQQFNSLFDEASKKLEKKKRKNASSLKLLTQLNKERKCKEALVQDMTVDIQRRESNISKMSKEGEQAQKLITAYDSQYEWINDNKHLFGRPGSAFDFQAFPVNNNGKLKQLEEQYMALRKTINVKVMDMIDRVEQKEKSLKEMLSTVRKDKQKIEETISKLDQHKKEALDRTWRKVNVDFGAIFSDLLPGNTCRLDPIEGKEITDGLMVKVCLGKVWKQSLTELSGGQRSLIALSLILSLLQYKPAPFYILDEVDAALDLSHTQNIGQLFRSRFGGSQFIVVSLKDGMFNNANVLFRTKFRDGLSTVERMENSGKRKKKTIKAKIVEKSLIEDNVFA